MAHTCYGNCESKIYIKSLSEHLAYDFSTDELYRTHVPNATHYHHKGHLYSVRHVWNGRFPISTFFIDAEEVSNYKDFPAHDKTLYHNGEEWIMYVRGWPRENNEISIQTSTDFVYWSNPRLVKIHGTFHHESIYSFGVFEVNKEMYAVANILTHGDVFHVPDYHAGEFKIYPKAFKEIEGAWYVFTGINFDNIVGNSEQCFINVCVKGDTAYITTQESMRKHTHYCNIHEMETKPMFSRIFEMPVSELIK